MAALPPPTGLASRIFLALVIGVAGGTHVALAAGYLATTYRATANCLLQAGFACGVADTILGVLFVGLWIVPIVLGVGIAAFAFAMLSGPRRAGERPGSVTLCAVLMGVACVQAVAGLAIQVSPSALRLLSACAFVAAYGFAAVGLWRMRPAGLRIAIAVAGLSIAVSLYSIAMHPPFWPAHLGRIVLMAMALGCLLQSVTREAFEPG